MGACCYYLSRKQEVNKGKRCWEHLRVQLVVEWEYQKKVHEQLRELDWYCAQELKHKNKGLQSKCYDELVTLEVTEQDGAAKEEEILQKKIDELLAMEAQKLEGKKKTWQTETDLVQGQGWTAWRMENLAHENEYVRQHTRFS